MQDVVGALIYNGELIGNLEVKTSKLKGCILESDIAREIYRLFN